MKSQIHLLNPESFFPMDLSEEGKHSSSTQNKRKGMGRREKAKRQHTDESDTINDD